MLHKSASLKALAAQTVRTTVTQLLRTQLTQLTPTEAKRTFLLRPHPCVCPSKPMCGAGEGGKPVAAHPNQIVSVHIQHSTCTRRTLSKGTQHTCKHSHTPHIYTASNSSKIRASSYMHRLDGYKTHTQPFGCAFLPHNTSPTRHPHPTSLPTILVPHVYPHPTLLSLPPTPAFPVPPPALCLWSTPHTHMDTPASRPLALPQAQLAKPTPPPHSHSLVYS